DGMSTPCRSAVILLLALFVGAVSPRADAAEPLYFETAVRPILKAHCFHCHGEEEEHQGSLDLRLVRTMTAGGDSGPAIAAGNVAESLLHTQISEDAMPPGDKKLSPAEKETIRAWIEQGAKTRRPEPESPSLALAWTE